MKNITNALDQIIKARQDKCDHSYQDRIKAINYIFCGKCGKHENGEEEEA